MYCMVGMIKKIIEKNADRFKEQYKQHVGKRLND